MCLQTVQRLADSWRNVIGSNGIAVVLAFLDDEPELQDSDKNMSNSPHSTLTNFTFYTETLKMRTERYLIPNMIQVVQR